ncbi:MAG TPA: shikimate dehydrogenase [Rhizomicrobium sp.]|jgi:shikimate dehydrogenase
MKRAGVIGWPVSHSLSPRLHAFWLREYGIHGAYLPLPVLREDFSIALRGLRAAGFAGVNVTLPHKEAAFALGDSSDDDSSAAGAANLLLFRDGRIEARNTDVEGLAANLAAEMDTAALQGSSAVVLGAGGAARAAALVCARLGAADVHVLNRTRQRADRLVAALAPVALAQLNAGSLDDWPALASATHLLINATSAGLRGTSSPDVALDALPQDAVICDLVYDPLETPLLARARARGLSCVDGLGMLIHQAQPAFEAFFGVRPVVTEAVRRHLEEALRDAG